MSKLGLEREECNTHTGSIPDNRLERGEKGKMFDQAYFKAGVTNMVPADTRSPARTTLVALGPVLKIALR